MGFKRKQDQKTDASEAGKSFYELKDPPPQIASARVNLAVKATSERSLQAPLGDVPRKVNTLQSWMALGLILIMGAPVLLSQLYHSDVVVADEAESILRSIQSWERLCRLTPREGLQAEAFLPYLHGVPSLHQPPGTTWLHMLSFVTLDTSQNMLEPFIFHARLVSVIFGLLTLTGVFWAGHSLGKRKTAMFSTLIFMANPVFIYYARLGTPTIIHAGWAMMAMAAALWAIRPLRPMPSTERQFLGWIGYGLAFGAATLTAGPITLATTLAPVFLIILMCPDRVSHLIGLLASVLIGVLLLTPWLIYAHEHDPMIWKYWISSIISLQHMDQHIVLYRITWRAWALAVLMAPWILWIIAMPFQPLSRSSSGRRISLWMASLWALGVMLLLIPMPVDPAWADLLPIIAPLCLALGHLFHHIVDHARTDHPLRTWRWLRWPQTIALLSISVLLPWALLHQPQLINHGYLPAKLQTNVSTPFVLALGGILLGILLLSLGSVIRHRPRMAIMCWSFWCLTVASAMVITLSHSQAAINQTRGDARQLAAKLHAANALWLQRDVQPVPPDPTFLLYVHKMIPGVSYSQLDHALDTLTADEIERKLILISSMDLQINHPQVKPMGILRNAHLRLWQYTNRK